MSIAANLAPAAAVSPYVRALERLHRYLDRFGHRLTTSGGQLDDLYVSLKEARLSLRLAEPSSRPLGEPPSVASPRPGPLELLADAFALDDVEREILLLAAAPCVDRDIARLYRFAWGDFTIKVPTVGFIAELAGETPGQVARGVAALRPDGALVRQRLVRLHVTDHWRPAPPLIHRGVIVPEGVLARLRGERSLPDKYGAVARTSVDDTLDLYMDEPCRARLEAAWAAALSGGPPLLLTGLAGSGRRSLLARVCADRHRPLFVVDARRIPTDTLDETLAEIAREARAEAGGLLIRADLDDAARADAMRGALRLVVSQFDLPLAITARRAPTRWDLTPDAVHIDIPPLSGAAQIELWGAVLGDADRASMLGARFNMPPGAIVDAARRGAGRLDESTEDPCAVLLRSRIDHALDAVADPVQTTLTWDDVVLPPDVRDALEEIRAQARHRSLVFDTWGFRRKMAYGRGLACLFAGPPGTGKTMMAGIIANDLGRAMYRVDLSRIVSKWVGETEKNLARVFDEAERAQVILFFDEADSLFSKRTEVKGANDRFANMEVNYLLQRMEQYDGISILTTNFESSLDEAFKRRLRFRIHFPLPDVEQRAELWQRMIPEQMAVADGIRWAVLGKRYKFSGGAIKNAVLRAAFYAADAEGELTQALLVRAAEAERREMGRL